jgi:hypothetical protein
MSYETDINFAGRDWILMKAWLKQTKETKVGLLIGAKTQEQSDKIRGALGLIDQLLALEDAANRPRKEEYTL